MVLRDHWQRSVRMTHPSQDALQRDQLKTALQSFSSASERLETAYAHLEAEVGSLKTALATTTEERDSARAENAETGTRRRKVDAALSRHQRLAALGEMAATLAHQIRTPLSAALLYTSNAANPAIPQPRRDDLLSRAIGCLNNLEQLVGDLLGFARGPVSIDTKRKEKISQTINNRQTLRGVTARSMAGQSNS